MKKQFLNPDSNWPKTEDVSGKIWFKLIRFLWLDGSVSRIYVCTRASFVLGHPLLSTRIAKLAQPALLYTGVSVFGSTVIRAIGYSGEDIVTEIR